MTKQVQIGLREPKCPSCDALLEKTADVQQEEYVLLEMAWHRLQEKVQGDPNQDL